MNSYRYNLVNAITWFRIISFPLLMVLIAVNTIHVFAWVLGLCFLTDLTDGYLARKWRVETEHGTRLDSIGDDLTILAGIAGAWFFKREFLIEQRLIIGTMLLLFMTQTILAFFRYGRITSFHTLLAKSAAILQGTFLILLFLMDSPFLPLFYGAALVTTLELLEEIVLVVLLKEWKTNVKGLYWVLRKR
jgi:CDP-diacylglycerol--glycerol-3-phosphate 3-phosphatidyltransferase